ncbi:uncharacterized protein LOC101860368 [Aplysia californica]|uniref:Uncharacterized protein LOC101860368 n=1 Tax=Aplysia californica TaxID=6500 RepID=A0ABM0K5L8_APLCA|nr:uncharacterized protein LOC101860368 [Aplysia californica]
MPHNYEIPLPPHGVPTHISEMLNSPVESMEGKSVKVVGRVASFNPETATAMLVEPKRSKVQAPRGNLRVNTWLVDAADFRPGSKVMLIGELELCVPEVFRKSGPCAKVGEKRVSEDSSQFEKMEESVQTSEAGEEVGSGETSKMNVLGDAEKHSKFEEGGSGKTSKVEEGGSGKSSKVQKKGDLGQNSNIEKGDSGKASKVEEIAESGEMSKGDGIGDSGETPKVVEMEDSRENSKILKREEMKNSGEASKVNKMEDSGDTSNGEVGRTVENGEVGVRGQMLRAKVMERSEQIMSKGEQEEKSGESRDPRGKSPPDCQLLVLKARMSKCADRLDYELYHRSVDVQRGFSNLV